MAATANYGWPVPELSDEPDGRAQITALAVAADADLKELADAVAELGGDVGPVDPDPAPTDATGGRFVNTGPQNIPPTTSGPGTLAAFPGTGANTPAPTDVTSASGGTIFTLTKGGVWWCGADVRIANAAAAGEMSLNIRADPAGGTNYSLTIASDGGKREGVPRSLDAGQATYLPQGTKVVVHVYNGTGSQRVTEPDSGAWVHLDLFRIG
jgi:hypothetical protein